MDYHNIQVVTVQLEMGPPRPGFMKVFNHLDQELVGIERLQLFLDNDNGLYELSFVQDGQEHSATLINIEYATIPEPPPVSS